MSETKNNVPKPFLQTGQDSTALPIEQWDKVSNQLTQLTTPTLEKNFYFTQDAAGTKYKINFSTGHDQQGQTFANIVKVTDQEMADWLK